MRATVPQTRTELVSPEMRSAGMPKPNRNISRIVRDATEHVGPDRRHNPQRQVDGAPQTAHAAATTSASTRMHGSAIRKILTLSRKARRTSGAEARNSAPLKKVSRTAGQPGADTITTARTAKTMTVLAERARCCGGRAVECGRADRVDVRRNGGAAQEPGGVVVAPAAVTTASGRLPRPRATGR